MSTGWVFFVYPLFLVSMPMSTKPRSSMDSETVDVPACPPSPRLASMARAADLALTSALLLMLPPRGVYLNNERREGRRAGMDHECFR